MPTPPVDYRSLELALKVRRRPAAISRAARSRVSNDRSRRGAAWEMSNTPFFFRRLFFRASVAFARARRRRRRSSLASDTRSSALLFVCLRRHRLGKKRRRNPLGSSARASPFTRLLRLASRSSRRSGRLRVRLHSVRACDIRRGPRPNPTSPASAFACEGSRTPFDAQNRASLDFRTRKYFRGQSRYGSGRGSNDPCIFKPLRLKSEPL